MITSMGVTIHFDGRLLDEAAFKSLVNTAAAFATSLGWLSEPIELEAATRARVRDNEDWDYCVPLKGVVLYPSEDCDPVRLEFDSDLYVQEYTKTQFAELETHINVVELLRILKPFFRSLRVEDEGEYWETESVQTLTEHLNAVQSVIDVELKKDPHARAKIKTPQGRIMDLYMSKAD
jgi:hypothetical protein